MKNIIRLALIVILSTFSVTSMKAQDEFSKFEKDKQINSVVVNKKMFEMMTNVKVDPKNEEEKAYFDLIKKLDNLRVFNTSNSTSKAQLKDAFTSYLNKGKLKQLSEKKTEGAVITIYINKDGNDKSVKELLMFNEGNGSKENIILLINGDFGLNEVSALTKKMNLPIGDSFK